MIWIIAIGILLFLGLMYPHFGKVALMGVGAVILLIVIAIGWMYVSSSNEQKAAESLISPAQLELINLELFRPTSSGGYPPPPGWNLTGEIKNNSNHTLTFAEVAITAFDCPEDTLTPQCETIGESDVYLGISDVPPHQRRSITNVTVYFNDMPAIKGNFLWSYEITETRGVKS